MIGVYSLRVEVDFTNSTPDNIRYCGTVNVFGHTVITCDDDTYTNTQARLLRSLMQDLAAAMGEVAAAL